MSRVTRFLTGATAVVLVASAGWLATSIPTADAAQFKFSDDEVEDIIGNVQKPEVTVLITRENLNKSYELDLDESFLKKIIDSVESDPF
jgi:hypothetical protein